MGSARRLATMIGLATALGALSVLPMATAASAEASTTFSIDSTSQYEYLPTCSNTAPFPCGQTALVLAFRIYTSHIYNHDITVNWSISGGTATAGSDFTGSTTGTVTIAKNTVNHEVDIQLVNDGWGESSETFNVHLTGASVPGDLSAVGTETILDGSRIPADCSLGKTDPGEESMTCTNRPANQNWYLDAECIYPWGDPEIIGNTVTGNGTSEGTCGFGHTLLYGATFNTI
jgi:hypothetical protein